MKTTSLRSRAGKWWKNEIRPLLIITMVVFSIRSSLADWNDVPTGSMKPTILEGDRVFVNKLAYDLKVPFTTWHLAQWGDPQRGDIVVFFSPHDGKRLVKRVVGLPGDLIQMRDESLIINGSALSYTALGSDVSNRLSNQEQLRSVFATEHLAGHPHAIMAIPGVRAMRSFEPTRVLEGHYFLMGDNRDDSFDSRYFGMVERKQIVGEALGVAFSLNRSRYWLPRADRFFKPLDE